jgi:RNA polymerase-binding transcription factor DksA
MAGPVAVSQHDERSQLATGPADRVRAQLLAEAESHASALARCTSALMTNSPENTTDLARAMNALRMYTAREALEEIEAALARVEAGTYGICLACDRPIPLEQLVTIPQARFCAACPAPASPAADGSPGPRLGSGLGERPGLPPPVRAPRPS